jgi:CarD family transcriptional regulator
MKTKKSKSSTRASKTKKESSLAEQILAKTSNKKTTTGKAKTAKTKTADNEIKLESITIKSIVGNKNTKSSFKVGNYVVYPSHGVGKIVEIEKTMILDQEFSYYLIHFAKERLNIKVPVKTAAKVGLRNLVTKKQMDEVFGTLRSGVKKLKGMWSRRAQEYETKINSGDIMLLAEVIRDLTRDIEDSERSYSERIIYETAIYRLSSEYAAIYGVEFEDAKDHVLTIAKDKLNSEEESSTKDDFDFAFSDKDSEDRDDFDDDDDDDDDDDYEDDDDFEESANG